VVGEDRAAKLLFLVLTSRLLERPLCAIVKGPSSSGKSFLVDQVLKFFPPDAYYKLSSMSEKALIYSEESFQHRIIILAEASGIQSDFTSYVIRSMVSEGEFAYATVIDYKQKDIKKEGPVGFIITTTAVKLHPENENRMLSITTNDTPEQTTRIILATACKAPSNFDAKPWHAMQEFLASEKPSIVIPYAEALASEIPPVSVRLRRDFPMILRLIETHAMLHQFQRSIDSEGRIIATLDDYDVIWGLASDLIGEWSEIKVSETVRETVKTVEALSSIGQVTVSRVAKVLKLDKSAALRRVRQAIKLGYVVNLEGHKERPAWLILGEPLPNDQQILPSPDRVAQVAGAVNGQIQP
jgi:hypothetical protein